MSPPLIQLKNATLALGHEVLAEDVDLALAPGDRAALVGRNGSGKSTLLRALAGQLDLDAGDRFIQPAARVAYLPQQPDLPADQTVADHVAAGLPSDVTDARHRVDAVMARLDVQGDWRLGHLSGGEGRRAALARTLVMEPDILLLDEPTNHLDMPTIEWLEGELARFDGALMVISHDRAFLRRLTNMVYWLDRGTMRRLDKGFSHFDDWQEQVFAEEEQRLYQLKKKLQREELWLHQGLSARRKRNQGRLKRLNELREQRKEMLTNRTGSANLQVAEAQGSGKTVIEAEHIAKTFTGADGSAVPIVRDFSTRIRKGDRIGIVGPNGAGKTTLIKMLTGEIEPDTGKVKHGKRLEPIYFDQRREQLDPEKTLWETLCPGGGDQVMIGDQPRHVVAYLRDFLFRDGQARQPVKALSGGETNRLLLAKLFAMPSNLIVMDEPTNDLDMETLDLLIEVLGDYNGTLLLVSHDRDFLDKTVTSVVVMEGDGEVEELPGGYTDALKQRRQTGGGKAKRGKSSGKAGKRESGGAGEASQRAGKLSYKEQRELDQLPGQMERLQQKIETLQAQIDDPDFYQRDPDRFHEAVDALEKAQTALEKAETRWLELEERKAALQGSM
jgi:ATP-binding cassette subfamily F protein uup